VVLGLRQAVSHPCSGGEALPCLPDQAGPGEADHDPSLARIVPDGARVSGQVVSLCDLTGNMVRPWAEAGYDCLCLDLQHSIRADRVEQVGTGSITYRWGDVRQFERFRAVFVAAFPPCTDLAVSGARDFARKGLRRFIDALEVVEACRILCEWSDAPWMIENPVGRLSTAWRAPDFTFDPCDYGDPYTKRTCLWMGNGFVMPTSNPVGVPGLFGGHDAVVPIEGSKMHLVPPSAERANLRSETPMGFARAVFAANAPSAVRGAA
jgi:hypothetical protein